MVKVVRTDQQLKDGRFCVSVVIGLQDLVGLAVDAVELVLGEIAAFSGRPKARAGSLARSFAVSLLIRASFNL
jgi:hypothetical protein